MKERLFKVLFIIFVVLLATLSFFIYLQKHTEKDFEIDFLAVGQGDSELIKAPGGQNIIIDGGPDNSVLKRLGENLPFWDRTIDLMILTHPHDDHVTGLVEVVKRYDVKKIIYTGIPHSAPSYLAWLTAVKDKKIPVVIIDKKQRIDLGSDCFIDIIYPGESLVGKSVDDLNNTSIIMKIVYGRSRFLLAGDAGIDIENKLIAEKIDLSADVFKASHHGSDFSNSENFLRLINPSIVVIEVGKDNSYGHPSGRTMKRFERTGSAIYRTDLDGTVKIRSDGNIAKVEPF